MDGTSEAPKPAPKSTKRREKEAPLLASEKEELQRLAGIQSEEQ